MTNGYYFAAEIKAVSDSDELSSMERSSVRWLNKFEAKDYEDVPSRPLPAGVCCVVFLVGAGIGILICRKKKKASASTKEEDIE